MAASSHGHRTVLSLVIGEPGLPAPAPPSPVAVAVPVLVAGLTTGLETGLRATTTETSTTASTPARTTRVRWDPNRPDGLPSADRGV